MSEALRCQVLDALVSGGMISSPPAVRRGIHVALWVLASLLAACSRNELRGKSVPSANGRTSLVVAESPGCAALRVDGKPWPHALGVPGPVPPGVRQIACADGSNEIGFEVEPGTTFHFDYWGP
jgi:hypothetical protein